MIRIKSEIWRRRRYRYYSAQTRHDRRAKIFQLFLVLLGLGAANVIAMIQFEGLGPADAIWLTMTTMTTVGYGDMSASTLPGRMATVVLMYVFGIFLLAQIAGEWFDYRLDRRERMRKGQWRWKMNDHIVIINTPKYDGPKYLRILVEQIRGTPLLADCPIQVMSSDFPDGLPSDIAAMGVVLHSGRPEGLADLSDVDVQSARFIVIMAEDTGDYRSDSLTLDVLDQLSSFDSHGYVLAECVQEANRQRLIHHGANAVIRPVRAYPELLVRAMAAPGTEAIMEDLFRYQGTHPRRYDVHFNHQPWGELASRLLKQGLGTPLGYLGLDDNIVVNPHPDGAVSGKALFLMVSQDAEYQPERVSACLQ
ncbi:MAG: potassium channel family protein [Proteobacteria bacterium]|jgi:voltage-gated potassium channel|nr:potassium channel family protein [Pseudomonadota bacterium]MDA1300942.1 potassium channel family protein [Pseudomonadota bacterium]